MNKVFVCNVNDLVLTRQRPLEQNYSLLPRIDICTFIFTILEVPVGFSKLMNWI